MEDILDWIRSKKDDWKDPTGVFKKVDKLLPEKTRLKPQDRARYVKAALDWMRNKGGQKQEIEGALDWMMKKSVSHSTMLLSSPIEKLGSIPVSRRTPEDREKDIDELQLQAVAGFQF